jgi:hypothetical protein
LVFFEKISSRDLEGDDISYYFHVASVDKEGRIGDTTSIAFRIDTTPPQNVSVIPPDNTSNRNMNFMIVMIFYLLFRALNTIISHKKIVIFIDEFDGIPIHENKKLFNDIKKIISGL